MASMIQNADTDRVNVRAANELAGADHSPADDLTIPDAVIDAKDSHNETAVADIVKLAAATIDPADMLSKYAKLGRAFLDHARWQRSNFKAWDKDDFDRLAARIEDQVKLQVAIKDVRMDVYARVATFVDLVKPHAPSVVKLSYYQVANKFLPMISFDKVDVGGTIKAEWMVFLVEAVNRQTSADKWSIKELDSAIDARKAEIKAAADAKVSPDKLAERERKAENAKIVQARESATNGIGRAVKAAVEAGLAGMDITQAVASMATALDVKVPTAVEYVSTGFDPKAATVEDCRKMMAVLFHEGKISEIKIIAEVAAQMVASFQAATVKLSA